MNEEIKPIFIFSLPRSGSTLLQKMLMTHPKINSVAEPWLLLPIINMQKKTGSLARYSHETCYRAVKDFISNCGGEKEYRNSLRKFILELYKKASDINHLYFLDKTPRYYMIIPDINKIFPGAKYIFLFRNPLSIYSSIMKTFNRNNYFLFHTHYIDLFYGPKLLTEGYQILKNNCVKINYESLVEDPVENIKMLSKYIEVKFSGFKITKFNEQNLKGKMGDKVGIRKYNTINYNLSKWKNTFNTEYRKKLAIKYIRDLDHSFLELTNINREKIINDISNIKTYRLGIQDFLGLKISNVYRRLKIKFQTQNHFDLIKPNNENYIYF